MVAMNSKAVFVVVVVLAVSIVPESRAFTAGGGGNIPALHGKPGTLSVSSGPTQPSSAERICTMLSPWKIKNDLERKEGKYAFAPQTTWIQ